MTKDMTPYGNDRLVTSSEIARMFRVDPKTVSRWATAGRLPSMKTPGGHRRYWLGDVQRLIAETAEAGDPLTNLGPLESFTRWVVSLDDASGAGHEARKTVTLNQIIKRAREALLTLHPNNE